MTKVTKMTGPTPSPIPIRSNQQEKAVEAEKTSSLTTRSAKPPVHPIAHNVRLRIHFDDLSHPASARFSTTIPLQNLIQDAITNVQIHLFTPTSTIQSHLFSSPTSSIIRPPQQPIPPPWLPQPVRSVTLIIYGFSGVAYTTGTRLDEAHKEIHVSLDHAANNASKSDADYIHEIHGVITHEMVHCFQHNARNSCPGGLIEGIADYVRIKSGLGAQHWKKWPANVKSRGEKWDGGYERTAWFLEWVEEKVGGIVGRLNHEMARREWDDGKIWEEVTGKRVEKWWDEYVGAWKGMNKQRGLDGECDE